MFKPPSLWDSVMAAITNQHTNQGDKPGEYIKKKKSYSKRYENTKEVFWGAGEKEKEAKSF